jgi:uncharacterized protein YodC (DUF2158 family)
VSVGNKWKVGDLVRLKSGGPVMTVEGYSVPTVMLEGDVPQVSCGYFPEVGSALAAIGGNKTMYGDPQSFDFSEDALEAVKS